MAEPHTRAVIDGKPATIVEGPVWTGADERDVECTRLSAQWRDKTILYTPGFPLASTYVRGVVESVVDLDRLGYTAIVRHFLFGTEVRRRVDVRALREWADAPIRQPFTLPEESAA